MDKETKDTRVEIKSTHSDLMEVALVAFKSTGGAQIEVSEGTRKVKIGAMPEGINKLIHVGAALLQDYHTSELIKRSNNKTE